MPRHTLALLVAVAAALTLALWAILPRDDGDDTLARQGHTWVEGEREPLADAPEAESLVAPAAPDGGSRAAGEGTDGRARDAAPQVPPTDDAEVVPFAAPGVALATDTRRERGRLEVSLRKGATQHDDFPVVASLVCRRAFGDEPVRATDSWPNPRFVFQDLEGDVALVITCTDAAPIEIAYGNAALSHTLDIDIDALMQPLYVEVHTPVALVRDALASAREVALVERADGGSEGGSDAFPDAPPALADGGWRELWIGLADGRATAKEAVEVDALEGWLEPHAWVLGGVLRLPFADGGDRYAGDGVELVVGRDWSRDALALASGVPHALVARRVEHPVALQQPPEHVEVAAFELVPKDVVLAPRFGHELAHELVFEIVGAAGDPPAHLEFTSYGGVARSGEPALEQHLLPVRIENGRALARLALDPFALVPLPRAMLRVPGHAPFFFDLPGVLAAGELAVEFEPGDGGVVLGAPERRTTAIPPVAHLDVAWNGRSARFDPLGYAEFAAPIGPGGGAVFGSDATTFTAAAVALLDPTPRARVLGLPMAVTKPVARDLAPGVVLLEVTRR